MGTTDMKFAFKGAGTSNKAALSILISKHVKASQKDTFEKDFVRLINQLHEAEIQEEADIRRTHTWLTEKLEQHQAMKATPATARLHPSRASPPEWPWARLA